MRPVSSQWWAIASASTTSVPGRSATWRSARAAIAVRRGSITTVRAPRATARCTRGGKCVFEMVGFAPQITTRSLCTTSAGSAELIAPSTLCHARPIVCAQIVCSTRVAPSASNSASVALCCSIAAADELYVNATIESGPASPIAPRTSAAIDPSASSHVARRKDPSPLRPVRTRGDRTRIGECTRRACRFTLAQIHPSVNSLSRDASTAVIRPSVTVTASEHASGQSSVHAVRTTWVVMPNGVAGWRSLRNGFAGCSGANRRRASPTSQKGR